MRLAERSVGTMVETHQKVLKRLENVRDYYRGKADELQDRANILPCCFNTYDIFEAKADALENARIQCAATAKEPSRYLLLYVHDGTIDLSWHPTYEDARACRRSQMLDEGCALADMDVAAYREATYGYDIHNGWMHDEGGREALWKIIPV